MSGGDKKGLCEPISPFDSSLKGGTPEDCQRVRENPAWITADLLLNIKAVQWRAADPFTLTSGRFSPVYVDCRKIISYPQARTKIIELAVHAIKEQIGVEGLDVIAGGETAGIPFAAWIAGQMNMPMVYVRKQPKGCGRMAQIEGDLGNGARVLLVEDLATDGGSKAVFIKALRQAGAKIDHVFVIFSYGILSNLTRIMDDLAVRFHSLAQWSDILAVGQARGIINQETEKQILSFLNDPDAWSAKMAEKMKRKEAVPGGL